MLHEILLYDVQRKKYMVFKTYSYTISLLVRKGVGLFGLLDADTCITAPVSERLVPFLDGRLFGVHPFVKCVRSQCATLTGIHHHEPLFFPQMNLNSFMIKNYKTFLYDILEFAFDPLQVLD